MPMPAPVQTREYWVKNKAYRNSFELCKSCYSFRKFVIFFTTLLVVRLVHTNNLIQYLYRTGFPKA